MPKKTLTPTKRHRQVARDIAAGATFKDAMIENGYSESLSNQGQRHITRRIPSLGKAIFEELKRAAKAAKKAMLPAEDLDALIQGRLAMNTLTGQDGGATSAKILGQHRRLNLWEPDVAIGIVSVVPPSDWKDRYSLKPELSAAESTKRGKSEVLSDGGGDDGGSSSNSSGQ